jgi:hypothetical protein
MITGILPPEILNATTGTAVATAIIMTITVSTVIIMISEEIMALTTTGLMTGTGWILTALLKEGITILAVAGIIMVVSDGMMI